MPLKKGNSLMKLSSIVGLVVLSVVFNGTHGVVLRADEPVSIGDKRELFVDTFLIDMLDNAELILHEPRDEGIVFTFDRPWEGLFSGYGTIIARPGKYQLYYRGRPELSSDGGDGEYTCYAESEDGISWVRPMISTYSFGGSLENNIILADAAPVTHNFSPFYDTRSECGDECRYKAVGGTSKSGLIAYVSADGKSWERLQDAPVITDEGWIFDSQNVVFWSEHEACYVCYYRKSVEGKRAIARVTSSDFVNWSSPVQMTYSNTGSTIPANHLYTNQTHPYFRAPHIYLATAARFMPGRKVITEQQAAEIGVHPRYFNDTSDAVFMTSRGGNLYDCTFDQGFVRPGLGLSNWVSRTNYPVLNVVETGPAEISVYTNQDYGQPTAHLHRYSLRMDGFASLRVRGEKGEAITKPILFSGDELHINFATSAAGGVKVEIQDSLGEPLPGFALEDADTIIGNEVAKVVTWRGSGDVSGLQSQPVRLRFVLEDADLFSFKFQVEK